MNGWMNGCMQDGTEGDVNTGVSVGEGERGGGGEGGEERAREGV